MPSNKKIIGWKPVAYNLNAASARLRCYTPLAALQKQNVSAELYRADHADDYQIVVIQKSCDAVDIEIAKRAKARGAQVVYDGCDNLFYAEPGDKTHIERAARLRRLLEYCSQVTVSTPALREIFLNESGHDSIIIPDPVISPKFLSRWRLIAARNALQKQLHVLIGKGPLELVWYGNHAISGAQGGLRDLLDIAAVIEELHQTFPLRLTVISNGREMFDNHIRPLPFPTQYLEWQHYAQFCGILPAYDICVIPFSPNPITQCKSNNRLALALYLGVPVVADGIPSYQEFAPFTQLDNWSSGLHAYASSKRLRKQHVLAGKEYVKTHYTLPHIARRWKALFDEML